MNRQTPLQKSQHELCEAMDKFLTSEINRKRTEEARGGIVYNEPQAAFEAAIASGRLSASAWDWNYAGKYMYMGTQNGRDLFKNSVTREYLK